MSMGRFNALELDVVEPVSAADVVSGRAGGEAVRDADYYLKEAGNLLMERRLEPALRSYSKALEIDPGSVSAWNGQIGCLIRLGELHEAGLWAKKSAEIVGESQELLALRARIACRGGDFDRAYGLSDAAMQMAGNSPLAWVVRGEIMLYARNKRPEYCFDKALSVSGNDSGVVMDIVECCMFSGKNSLGFKYLTPALDRNPEAVSLWMLAARCFQRFGNRNRALECVDAVMERIPDDPGAENLRAELLNEGFLKNLFRRIFK